eukprot:5434886-Pyramimonas_sp.AAC.1
MRREREREPSSQRSGLSDTDDATSPALGAAIRAWGQRGHERLESGRAARPTADRARQQLEK